MRRILGAASLARALLVVFAVRLALIVWPFASVHELVDRKSRPRTGASPASRTPARVVAGRVDRVARFVPGATCLVRSLAARLLLGWAGHESRLRIGVARPGQAGLEAHAWVECDGVTVLGATTDTHFTPLPDLPPRSRAS
ncbi:MAG: lasso peptide biosynthesis B2 protein [Acidobacteria bacterium]|nr:lasso peptide biosynthesis B2 protein [Acidobacteriota bacterium]